MRESVQKKLERIKPPRVQITYEVETAGAILKKELPCIIGIISDLSGYRDEDFPKYVDRKFVYIDSGNFNDVLKAFNPQVNLSVEVSGVNHEIKLKFKDIDDFNPLNIIKKNEILNTIYLRRKNLSNLSVKLLNNLNLLSIAEKITNGENKEEALNSFNFCNDEQRENLLKLFEFLPENSKNIINDIQKEISVIDQDISLALNQILHNKDFQKLEGSWLGLKYLINNIETSEFLKVRVFNCQMNEIKKDLNRAMDFDSSNLFYKIYEEEYGTYGGNPYTFIGLDFYCEKKQDDFVFLGKISEVLASAHLPGAIGVGSSIFDISSFENLHTIRDLYKIFESSEMAKFLSFRQIEDSRYLAGILPRFMGRIPYGPNTQPVENLNYKELINSHEDFSWSNSIYAYAQKIGECFAQSGWFASILGPENGGLISNLPVFASKTKNGDMNIKCPTETVITDRMEKELSNNGFISLCHCKDTDYSVFFSGQSFNKPPIYNKSEANANAKLSARFQYMINTSRFAHYLKCIMRDKIGTFTNVDEINKFLNDWIADYILLSDTSDSSIKASFPLKAANIDVQEDLSTPGKYNAIIFLRPHFQMEELKISMRLVAKIPKQST